MKEDLWAFFEGAGGRCSTPRRCLEHLWFDVTYGGARHRMPASEFAIPRMEPGKQRPIQSMEETRDWERLFIGEIKAGRDPRRPRVKRKAGDVVPKSVADFLDAYLERGASSRRGYGASARFKVVWRH